MTTLGRTAVGFEGVGALPMNSSPSRWAWEVVAWLALGLGFLGIPLPLLPTTPFILLALFAFSKSHPSMQSWIVRNRFIGPPVVAWQKKRGISPATRISAIGTIGISFSISIWFSRHNDVIPILLSVGGLVLLILVMRLPIVSDDGDT